MCDDVGDLSFTEACFAAARVHDEAPGLVRLRSTCRRLKQQNLRTDATPPPQGVFERPRQDDFKPFSTTRTSTNPSHFRPPELARIGVIFDHQN